MKNLLALIGGLICLVELNAQQPYNALPKYSQAQVREDARVLKKVLDANHPSLHWFTPKQELDSAFEKMLNSITDSLN